MENGDYIAINVCVYIYIYIYYNLEIFLSWKVNILRCNAQIQIPMENLNQTTINK